MKGLVLTMLQVDEEIKIGNTVLPGIVQKIEVNGEALIDEVEVEGSKKRPKQAIGYNDITVKITLILTNETDSDVYEKLKVLQNAFKKPSQSKPEGQSIFNKHLSIRGVTKVIFNKLTTSEDSKSDKMKVTLDFMEYNPVTIAVSNSSSSSTQATYSSNVSEEFEEYLEERGKVADSPIKDVDKLKNLIE